MNAYNGFCSNLNKEKHNAQLSNDTNIECVHEVHYLIYAIAMTNFINERS